MQTASPAARWFEPPPPAISEPGRKRKMPLVSKSMPCRQQPFETTSSPAWKANRRARRRPHGPHSPTRDRTVRRRQGLRVPNLGDNREGSVRRFRELHQDRCGRSAVNDCPLTVTRQQVEGLPGFPQTAWPADARSAGRTKRAEQSRFRILDLPRHTARNRCPRTRRARVVDSDLQIIGYLVQPSGRFLFFPPISAS